MVFGSEGLGSQCDPEERYYTKLRQKWVEYGLKDYTWSGFSGPLVVPRQFVGDVLVEG